MYAVDRVKPLVPLKIEEAEDASLEEARQKRAELEAKKAKSASDASSQGGVEYVTHEFN